MRIFFFPLFLLISLLPNFFIPNVNSAHGQYLEDQKIVGNFKFESSMSTKLVSGRCRDDQRSLLIQFKNSLIFNRTTSTKLVTWNQSDEDCCTWNGVTCDSSGHVISLELDNESISGGIENSTSLSGFRYLEKLNLVNNRFNNVMIPNGIYNLSNLTYLNLSNAGFVGQIPVEVSHMTRLVTLDLSTMFHRVGIKPLKLEDPNLKTLVQNLKELQHLYLDGVKISATGSEWCVALSSSLPKLRTLSLSNCKLSGPVDSSFSQLQLRLTYLDLSLNNLTGFVPPFYMSKKLTYIDLSHNGLSGSLSSTHFEGLANLVYVNLGYNSLNGSIPLVLFELPSLQYLQLSDNQFGGQLGESSSTSLSQLDTLDLSSNRLQGPIPKFFFELQKLTVLSLSFNFYNGTVEMRDIQNLQYLVWLNLDHNRLSINASSSSMGSAFPQLVRLNLASCNLQHIPDLRNQSKMMFLDLSDNQITGEIPNWIWEVGNGSLTYLNLSHNLLQHLQKPYKIPSLIVLDIHSNHIHGDLPIPPSSAMYIDYSSNKFNSSVPADIGNSNFHSFFSISDNSLMGDIPESICKASYLQVLDLSSNSLSGKIPNCLLSNEYLGVLNLGRNNLSSAIPDTFSTYCRLRTLDFGRNNLTGQIPKSLANCKLLEVLNVGNNNIKDTVPRMLENSSSLRVIILRSNRFHGDLWCNNNWPNLQIIDIASNNFSGNLSPRFFLGWRGMMLNNNIKLDHNHLTFDFVNLKNLFYQYNLYYQDTVTVTIKGLELELVKILTVFTSIDLSCNNFHGEIPETIGNLSSLYILNMSHNALTGQIPKSIGKLSQLGSLDLSKNKLTGVIPKELTGLTFLSSLNLSYNMLSGRIPNDRQFLTFSYASYEGNVGLCGFPLNKTCADISPPSSRDNSETNEINWVYVSAALGFSVGFGTTMGYFYWFCDSTLFMRSIYFIIYIYGSCIRRCRNVLLSD